MCDDLDIKSLPYEFVPNKNPSKILERLKVRRKNAHNEAVEKMRTKMIKLNEETDEVITKKSVEFQNSLRKIRSKVDEAFAGLENIQENQFSLEDHAFSNAKLEMDEAKCVIGSIIDNYIQELFKLESKRKDRLKVLLQETSINLENIAYESPFKIADFIETEMLNLNKVILNNHQNINDIEKDIKLEAEYNIKLWNEHILEIKESLKKYLKALTKLSIVKMRSTIITTVDSIPSGELRSQISQIALLQSELKLFSSLESVVPVTYEQVDSWLKGVQLVLASLDENAKYLVNNYKSIIIILFNRFFEELEDLKINILKTGIIEKTELEDFEGDIYTPPVEELKIKYTEDLEKIQNVWGEAIKTMKDGVKDTYNFLRKAASLWDRHFVRLRDAQVLVESAVENTVAKNSHTSQMFEIKVNMLLDKLRQCPEEKKLEKMLIEAKLLLDDIEKKYAADYVSELQSAGKYHTIIENEIDVLVAEIRRYLTLYPRDDERDPKKQRKRASQESTKPIDSNEKLIPVNLMYCIFQVDAVKNWKFGLWEAINNYLETARQEILNKADEWVNKQREKIQKRHDVKCAIHTPRYSRIVSSIYDKRVRELGEHTSRFSEHKKAIDIELKKLNSTLQTNRETYKKIISDFENVSDIFKVQIQTFKKSCQVNGQLTVLQSKECHCKVLLKEAAEKSKLEGHNLLNTIQTSNLLMLKAIQFFSELGNFSVEEAIDWEKNVRKLDDTLQHEVNNFKRVVDQDYQKFALELDQRYNEVSSHAVQAIKELEFNELSVKHIVQCQNGLKSEVILAKTKLRNIDITVKNLMQECKDNMGDDEFLITLQDKMTSLTGTVHDLERYLEYRKSIKLNSSKRTGRRKSLVPSKPSMSTTSVSQRRKSNPSVQSIEDNLISNFNWVLMDSYKDIRSNASSFYSKHTQFVMTEDTIHHSYDKFMGEVLHNYERLVNQCGIFWLEICQQLLTLLENLRIFVKSYARNYEMIFYKNSQKQCSNTLEEIMDELALIKNEAQNDVKSMYKKLKALHGHPRNKKLLNELEKEFNNMAEKYSDKFVNILQPYNQRMETETEMLIERYQIIKPKTDALSETTILTQMIENVKSETVMKVDSVPEVSDTKSVTEDDISIHKSISKELLTNLSRETVQSFTPQEISATSFSSSDSFEYSEDFIHDIQMNLEVNTKKISEFVEGHLVTCIKRFNEMWADEIKNVINLYKLRYE